MGELEKALLIFLPNLARTLKHNEIYETTFKFLCNESKF